MRHHTLLTDRLADLITERLAKGERMKQIAADLGVSTTTIAYWEAQNVRGFGDQMTVARRAMATTLTEEMLEIADDCPIHAASIARAALQIKTRLSIITLLKPEPRPEVVSPTKIDDDADQQTPAQFLRERQSRNPTKVLDA